MLAIRILTGCLAWSPALGQNTGGFYFGPTAEKSEGSCTDNKGQIIPEGLLFTPGLDECQVCTCLRNMPVLCRTVLCAPPKNCLSLRVVDACCQWICDDWESPPGSFSDIGLRLVASAVTAILSLSLLVFLIYRLRQRRLRGRQNHLQAERFNSEAGQNDDRWVGDTQLSSFGSFVGWRKPLDSTFQRPFPPSYDEAVSYASTMETMVEPVAPAPPYHSFTDDPVVPYQVATLGRRVLPVGIEATRTLPAGLRRIHRQESSSSPAGHGLNSVSTESGENRNLFRRSDNSIWTSTTPLGDGSANAREDFEHEDDIDPALDMNTSQSRSLPSNSCTNLSRRVIPAADQLVDARRTPVSSQEFDADRRGSFCAEEEDSADTDISQHMSVVQDRAESSRSSHSIIEGSQGTSGCFVSSFSSPTHV